MRSILLAALLSACSCAPSLWPHPPAEYNDYVSYRMLSAAAILEVTCVGGQKVGGSGVAISTRHLLTAKHVVEACEHYLGVEVWSIKVTVGLEQKQYEATVDEVSEKYDVARIVIVGTREPLMVWVPPAPRLKNGQEVCTVSGDVSANLLTFKCGRVIEQADDGVLFMIHVVPGNSGSPLYDTSGRLVGIVVMRSLTQENWGIAVSIHGFMPLASIPPPMQMH